MNEKEPLVMCLTNTVAADITANMLLAIGAKPAMIEEPTEAAELASVADAMLVNVGTVTPFQAETMRAAIAAANAAKVPWVLDPVAVDLLTYRRELVFEFIKANPTLIRGNSREIGFLYRKLPDLSIPTLSTGEVDEIRIVGTVPNKMVGTVPEKVAGGVAMLQSVTATGCAQGAIAAALLGRGQSPLNAARNASRLMKRAGELAVRDSRFAGPGSFRAALIDAVSQIAHDLSGGFIETVLPLNRKID